MLWVILVMSKREIKPQIGKRAIMHHVKNPGQLFVTARNFCVLLAEGSRIYVLSHVSALVEAAEDAESAICYLVL